MSHLVIGGVKRPVMGWKKEPHDPRDRKLSAPSPQELEALPPSVDPPVDLPPTFHQANQDCVANSTVTAFMFPQHKGQADEPYSRRYVYARGRMIDGAPLTEDQGTYIRSAFKASAQNGICKESVFPYSNDVSVFPTPEADADAAKHKALLYYRCPDLYTVKASLAQGFPVVFGSQFSEAMLHELGTTGLVHYPVAGEETPYGHAIVAIGYDDVKVIGPDAGFILIRNSWGPDAGIGGNAWIPQKLWTNGLADDCWTFRRVAV